MRKFWWFLIGVCVFMVATPASAQAQERFKLLATSRTGTMQRELNEAPPEFNVVGMTVFNSRFGGDEAAVILEAEIID